MSKKRYDTETKIQALKLKKEVGTRRASDELGIAMDTIGSWDRAVRDGKLILEGFEKTPENALSLRDENRILKEKIVKLEKEDKKKQMKIDFLEEATAFFAASHPKLRKMKDLNL